MKPRLRIVRLSPDLRVGCFIGSACDIDEGRLPYDGDGDGGRQTGILLRTGIERFVAGATRTLSAIAGDSG